MSRLSVAVITGGHKFHVRPFIDFFNGLDEVDAYIQYIDDWLSPSGLDDQPGFAHADGRKSAHQEVRDSFDVTLFYTLINGPYQGELKSCVERLISTGRPVFVLHHALLNWRKDPRWSEIIGMTRGNLLRDVDYGGPMNGIWYGTYPVKVNADHPASSGLTDFEINDETYALPDCDEDCDVLLTTEQESSMRTLAWTRLEVSSRIFCTQLGHDFKAWNNPDFRTLIQNGLHWCAGIRAADS
jgi:type 1 glutamine amidotransferase